MNDPEVTMLDAVATFRDVPGVLGAVAAAATVTARRHCRGRWDLLPPPPLPR